MNKLDLIIDYILAFNNQNGAAKKGMAVKSGIAHNKIGRAPIFHVHVLFAMKRK